MKEELIKYLKVIENYLKGMADDEGDFLQQKENFDLYKKAVKFQLDLRDKLIWNKPKQNDASKALNEHIKDIKLNDSDEFTLRMLIQNYAESHREPDSETLYNIAKVAEETPRSPSGDSLRELLNYGDYCGCKKPWTVSGSCVVCGKEYNDEYWRKKYNLK